MQDEYGGDDECEEYGDQVDIVDPGGMTLKIQMSMLREVLVFLYT
jgi:hypothetical protein